MYLLAIKIDNFAEEYDPYGYGDAFESRIEGIEAVMSDLLDGGKEIMDWLKEIAEESSSDHDEWWFHEAVELLAEVKAWAEKEKNK